MRKTILFLTLIFLSLLSQSQQIDKTAESLDSANTANNLKKKKRPVKTIGIISMVTGGAVFVSGLVTEAAEVGTETAATLVTASTVGLVPVEYKRRNTGTVLMISGAAIATTGLLMVLIKPKQKTEKFAFTLDTQRCNIASGNKFIQTFSPSLSFRYQLGK